MQELPQFVNV